MDLRRMSLIESPIRQISAARMDDYKLGPDKLELLESLMPAFVSAEYWDPAYQAWKPFLDTYLSSGVNPTLTQKYYPDLLNKELDIIPGDNKLSGLFREVLKLKNTSSTTIFNGIYYSDVISFCEDQCKFFVTSKKNIMKTLYTPEIYVSTLESLLALGTWKGLMCALYLYRHCQLEDISWPSQVVMPLQTKLGGWLESFLFSFDEATRFAGQAKVYDWYCPKVKDVLQRTWSTALLTSKRPDVLTATDVYAVSSDVATKLVSVVNSCPAVYDDPLKEQTVWNAMYPVFYGNPEDAATFCLNSYLAPCVPKSYFKRMCDTLYSFYWTVKDGLLTEQLYLRKQVEYNSGENLSETPENYLEGLYNRGFPSFEKGE